MNPRQRHTIVILVIALISLTLLAAPARGADWWGVQIGGGGFGLAFGSGDWDVWGASWSAPSWSIDYHVALSGYGEWVWVDGLGQCWQPWVTPTWRPFTYGRWVWTAYGWTWVAYEPWGYFPHHFGHWAMAPVGWVWVPGTSYHAANVVWVSSDAWIGWYPAPPPGWRHHHHGHHGGWDDGWRDARYATYVGWHELGDDDLSRRSFGADAVRARAPHAVLREGVAAPDRHQLARSGIEIPEMSLERRTARVAGREVVLARPREAAASVERNAVRTVEHALAPQAVSNVSRRAAAVAPAVDSTRGRADQGTARSTAGRSGGLEVRRAAPASRVEGARPPQRTGSRDSATATSGRPGHAARAPRPNASAAGAASRPAAAATSPSAASRPRTVVRTDEESHRGPATDTSKGRAEKRARRSEPGSDTAPAVRQSPSPGRR